MEVAVSYERGTPVVHAFRFRDGIAVEQGGDNLNGFNYFHPENGSSRVRIPVLTGLFVPSWLGSGVEFEFSEFCRTTAAVSTPVL